MYQTIGMPRHVEMAEELLNKTYQWLLCDTRARETRPPGPPGNLSNGRSTLGVCEL
jgi:hypothetical protein